MEKNRQKISRSALKEALKLYAYIRPYQGIFWLGMLFLLLSSAANLVFPKLLGDLVDAVNAENYREAIARIGKLLMLVLGAQALFSFFRIVLFVRVTEKALAGLRQATYQHLIRLPMKFFNQRRVGELNSRISADISLLQETFTTTLAEFLRQVFIIIGGITLLTITSWRLTLFMLAILPPVIIITIFFGKFIRRYAKAVQEKVADSQVVVEETLQGIYNVKSFINEGFEMLRYRKKTDEAAVAGIKGGLYRGAFTSFIVLGLFGAMVAVIWKGSNLIASGELETGQLFSFIIYSGFIGGSIGGLAEVYSRIQKAVGAAESLLAIFDEKTEDISLDAKAPYHKLKGEISVENLSFAYPSRPDMQVLNNISFSAKAGEKIAVVGTSGGGKSTLISLLLQFYREYNGQIMYDGKEARSHGLRDIRGSIGVVPQEVLLFGGSIIENIRYGKPDATKEEVELAAKKAFAHDFISKFPEGYDTLVGERGVQLSGGQRQRVAIARMILKDPSILLLDEATSALDSESENYVQKALEELMRGRTSIIIAHRLSTIRNTDRVLVIQEGSIVEQGTHHALLNKEDGYFRELSRMQQVGEVSENLT
ncbi:MAG: ATP-binding cassette domain-containing protein [Cryomorphaceae bacterium]|nr:ATP-binding cassette domain-containing protein [Cryomorphaceae bacterium]